MWAGIEYFRHDFLFRPFQQHQAGSLVAVLFRNPFVTFAQLTTNCNVNQGDCGTDLRGGPIVEFIRWRGAQNAGTVSKSPPGEFKF
jgi:hypothetical protein